MPNGVKTVNRMIAVGLIVYHFSIKKGKSVNKIFAVVCGGSLGCVLRWQLGARLNAMFPDLPPGTLLVNLLGGFIIGATLAYFLRNPGADPVWQLLITTGLCGGMTTFSTFSAEVFTLLQSGKYAWAAASVLMNVVGSLAMTTAGFYMINTLSS